jgi:hypothetical protein
MLPPLAGEMQGKKIPRDQEVGHGAFTRRYLLKERYVFVIKQPACHNRLSMALT